MNKSNIIYEKFSNDHLSSIHKCFWQGKRMCLLEELFSPFLGNLGFV